MQKRVISVVVAFAAIVGPAVMGPATSAGARPAAPSPLAGHYRIHYNWNLTGFTPAPMVLHRDHTGSEGQRTRKDPVTWSETGENVTIVVTTRSIVATYHGTTSATGLATRATPGTMSNNIGDSGTWYAVRVDKP